MEDWIAALTLVALAAFVAVRRGPSARASESLDRSSSGEQLERGRGRRADTPSEIPARGWKDILQRVYKNISDHRVIALAAGMTFYSLLALFPALAALVAIYSLFADPATIASQMEKLSGFLPAGAIDVARDQLARVASKGTQTLGFTFLIGLAISMWSANGAMKSLFDTLNIIYGETEKRSFIKLNIISLGFTFAAVAFVLVALGAIVALPVALKYVGLSEATDLLLRIGRWPALLLTLMFALAVVYRYGPSRNRARWRWVTWGCALAAPMWLAASGLFSWYAANFGKYNETYGSLGAVVGFMTWLWISAIVVLLGAELNAEMEHQTARDSTTGPPKPLGARGARMADTVGAAQDG